MKRREVLCVYGLSEEEAEVNFSSWLSEEASRKVVPLKEDSFLKKKAWELLLAELKLVLPEHITEVEKEKAHALFEELRFWQIGAEALLSDVKDLGKKVVTNLLANLPFLQGSLKASSFAGKFAKVPAIICGAGPSLNKHLNYLTSANEKALIFGSGSGVKFLHEQGIKLHFAAALDPDSPPQLFSEEAAESIPFFFPLRVASWLLPQVKGKRIWAADGVSYPLEQWLTSQLNLEETSVEGGWNAATFCIHLAVLMGCNPIILVGVDLALPQGKSYAEGIDHAYDKERLITTTQGTTKGDFILAADWIAELIKNHPHLTVYNVSQEAWKIPGVEHKNFEEILSVLPKRDVQGSVDEVLSKLEPIQISVDVKDVHASWQKSLVSVRGYSEELLSLFEKHFPFDPRTKGEYALKEVELEEEPVYRFLLEPIWQVWMPLFEQTCGKEPFDGFHKAVQKLLFCKNLIEEMQHAAI